MNEIMSQIIKIAQKYPIDKILLFGSRARGDSTPKSDIDLAIFYRKIGFESEFLTDIENIDTFLKFDIVFLNRNNIVEDEFYNNIITDGVVIMDKFQTKLQNLTNAVNRLKQAIDEYKITNSLAVRDGAIQRFEFSCELAWKTIRERLLDEGFINIDSPKSVMKEAFSAGIIENDKVWINMLNDRNSTSHIYEEEIAGQIYGRIENSYIEEFEKLIKFLN